MVITLLGILQLLSCHIFYIIKWPTHRSPRNKACSHLLPLKVLVGLKCPPHRKNYSRLPLECSGHSFREASITTECKKHAYIHEMKSLLHAHREDLKTGLLLLSRTNLDLPSPLTSSMLLHSTNNHWIWKRSPVCSHFPKQSSHLVTLLLTYFWRTGFECLQCSRHWNCQK